MSLDANKLIDHLFRLRADLADSVFDEIGMEQARCRGKAGPHLEAADKEIHAALESMLRAARSLRRYAATPRSETVP